MFIADSARGQGGSLAYCGLVSSFVVTDARPAQDWSIALVLEVLEALRKQACFVQLAVGGEHDIQKPCFLRKIVFYIKKKQTYPRHADIFVRVCST